MRFKIVACILLILSGFSFVLAAPVPVREVCEACADAVEGDENVIIVSGKRAALAQRHDPYDGDSDSSDSEWPAERGTSPSPDHAGGSHSGVDMPSSPSGGSESPLRLFSDVWSIPGTEVPLDSEGAFTPGTTTENQPASSSKTKKVNFWPTTKVHFFEPDLPPPPEDQPASSSKTKSVSWAPSKVILLPSGKIYSEPLSPETESLPMPPGGDGYLAKVAAQQSSSPEMEHASSSSYFDPPQAPPPQSKGFVSNFKTYFGKLGKLNFRPRFQRTVDTGSLTAGNFGESSNAPATSATGGILRRVAGMS